LENVEEYRLAQNTFECYARFHQYKWKVINFSSNKTLQKICPHSDFMFARHCVTAQIMEESDEEWFLFIDADMGVINPNHFIEEWIDNDVNLIFYDRIFNYEIMSGSYLARNVPYSLQFLRFWANYQFKLPNSFHGTDNGAIHNVFMELITPEMVKARRICEKLWNRSRTYDDLYVYEACARSVLGDSSKWFEKVRILRKGTSWARDIWLTNSMWGMRDFVLHGWQKRKMDAVVFASWPSPFSSHYFNMSLCETEDAAINWKYKDSFIRDNAEIDQYLNSFIENSSKNLIRTLAEISEFINLDEA
uniref:Nucleotid_trans domain-containing protein n=1 Tax=Dracunculus medinensis TaxID=318479 RepID=A0A0N4U796_DRAME